MADQQKPLNWWDRVMMAITFAEAGEADTARDILDEPKQKRMGARPEKPQEKRPELRV